MRDSVRLSLLLAGASIAALATPAFAQGQGAAPLPALVKDVKIPNQVFKLQNGLTVVVHEDRKAPIVAVSTWYNVGAKDEPAGKTGFAHLFEHLMFKATRNMVPEQVDRLTEDVGGFNNASTADDYTNYYETVPANHLRRLLWAEAQRMGSLVVDEPNFKPERDVVKEELRTGLARPYGRLFSHYIPMASYQRHPYARPGIGSIEELDAAIKEYADDFGYDLDEDGNPTDDGGDSERVTTRAREDVEEADEADETEKEAATA